MMSAGWGPGNKFCRGISFCSGAGITVGNAGVSANYSDDLYDLLRIGR
jgi:hypothetical protein